MALLLWAAPAGADLCDNSKHFCGYTRGSSGRSSRSSNPSQGSTVRLNPSKVPVEKGFGIEAIYFDEAADFSLVRGMGRVGAGISPSNSEETFFGPPGIEREIDYLERQRARHRYSAQKYTAAGAVNLFNSKGNGFRHFSLNLGGLAKYNIKTEDIRPGGGVSGYWGPFTFGYSIYQDQAHVPAWKIPGADIVLEGERIDEYTVETLSGGIYFKNLILDYSTLTTRGDLESRTKLLTAGVFLWRALITASLRWEESNRYLYDRRLDALVEKRVKAKTFAGLQVRVLNPLMLGAFYNYYLMDEASVGATLFF